MAEYRTNVDPPVEAVAPAAKAGVEQFQEGFEKGRDLARRYGEKVAAWTRENPGLALACAAGAGFILARLLSPKD